MTDTFDSCSNEDIYSHFYSKKLNLEIKETNRDEVNNGRENTAAKLRSQREQIFISSQDMSMTNLIRHNIETNTDGINRWER